jgi:hypothetical protein
VFLAVSRLVGLFCCNDIVALGVSRALKDAGLKVPADVSLIGFDDLPASKHGDPPEKPCAKVVIGGDLVARQSIRQRRTA